jgi:hypothetical protein
LRAAAEGQRWIASFSLSEWLMKPELRHVSQMPLAELWNEHGVLRTERIRELGSWEIAFMLRAGKVRFVIADIGHHLEWVSLEDCYKFWKSEVKMHLAQPENKTPLEDFPGDYCYFASQWKADHDEPIILLSKAH